MFPNFYIHDPLRLIYFVHDGNVYLKYRARLIGWEILPHHFWLQPFEVLTWWVSSLLWDICNVNLILRKGRNSYSIYGRVVWGERPNLNMVNVKGHRRGCFKVKEEQSELVQMERRIVWTAGAICGCWAITWTRQSEGRVFMIFFFRGKRSGWAQNGTVQFQRNQICWFFSLNSHHLLPPAVQ